MIKVLQIEFVRAVLEWQLKTNYENDHSYFSNEDIALFSFYEHLLNQDEVNRYVETYQAMVEEQNREDFIGFGVLATNTSPTITNLYSTFISPFDWLLRIRTKLANRDKMLGTLYKVVEELKGVKVDVASLHCVDENNNYIGEKLIPVGTIYEKIESGDYIGECNNTNISINYLITSIKNKLGYTDNIENGTIVYTSKANKLYKWVYKNDTFVSLNDEIPNHTSFEKFKLDMSLDDITCDEPYTLDANEYCDIRIGGNATLVSSGVRLGNDMVRLAIGKDKIVQSNDGTTDFSFRTNGNIDYTMLEPLEIPHSLSANSESNILKSNFFLANSNTDTITTTLQYTFICDMDIPLIRQWFNYSRYYNCNLTNSAITKNSITPNIIYSIKEYWNSWANIEVVEIKAKLVGSIDMENSESDTTTIQLTFQLQGDNN